MQDIVRITFGKHLMMEIVYAGAELSQVYYWVAKARVTAAQFELAFNMVEGGSDFTDAEGMTL